MLLSCAPCVARKKWWLTFLKPRLRAGAADDKAESKEVSMRKILVIDDNVDAANLTADLLRLYDLDVGVAYGGREGLAVARAFMPDVIFLDIGMPGMDGYAVAKALRGDTAPHRIKIVALTAWGDQASREQTKAAGFDLHIVKPARLPELIDIASGAAPS